MTYAIIRTLGARRDYARIEDGILHLTAEDLGNEWPHLVRTWKTKAAAKGVITRITKAYSEKYGVITDFSIVPFE